MKGGTRRDRPIWGQYMRRYKVGSRGSRLSRLQTEEVLGMLSEAHPGTEFEAVAIKTGGDAAPEAPLLGLGRGIFVKEIETALLEGSIDFAVHSLKDLLTILPQGLILGAICARADPRDVLVNCWARVLDEVPAGARMGTSSPRREAQLKEVRPDLKAIPIRGNVETRVAKSGGNDYDGVILAAAGLARLGLEDKIAQRLPAQQFVPAPGQGALAMEARSDDLETLELLQSVDHVTTRREVNAERAFLEAMGGGCQVPVGAYGQIEGGQLTLTVFLASTDGGRVFRATANGTPDDPQKVAADAYTLLVEQGAESILIQER